jgi:hypothetical protein
MFPAPRAGPGETVKIELEAAETSMVLGPKAPDPSLLKRPLRMPTCTVGRDTIRDAKWVNPCS